MGNHDAISSWKTQKSWTCDYIFSLKVVIAVVEVDQHWLETIPDSETDALLDDTSTDRVA
ncbi:MAG: hypothetical protein J6Y97_13695 [Prevotella sp.]|nr:hypothetical protein [Prevotella sp.]